MHRDQLILLALFAVSLALLTYYLGASVSGYAIKNMYCDGELCEDYCRFDSDCRGNEICCDINRFGVCQEAAQCTKEHEFTANEDNSIEQMNRLLEKPILDYKNEILMSMTLITALITLVAFHSKHKKAL